MEHGIEIRYRNEEKVNVLNYFSKFIATKTGPVFLADLDLTEERNMAGTVILNCVSEQSHHTVTIEQELCIHCNMCVEECKYDAVFYKDAMFSIDRPKCIGCDACLEICPPEAILKEQAKEFEIVLTRHPFGYYSFASGYPYLTAPPAILHKALDKMSLLASEKKVASRLFLVESSVDMDFEASFAFHVDFSENSVVPGVTVSNKQQSLLIPSTDATETIIRHINEHQNY